MLTVLFTDFKVWVLLPHSKLSNREGFYPKFYSYC